MKLCNCGNVNNDSSRFCSACGKDLSETVSAFNESTSTNGTGFSAEAANNGINCNATDDAACTFNSEGATEREFSDAPEANGFNTCSDDTGECNPDARNNDTDNSAHSHSAENADNHNESSPRAKRFSMYQLSLASIFSSKIVLFSAIVIAANAIIQILSQGIFQSTILFAVGLFIAHFSATQNKLKPSAFTCIKIYEILSLIAGIASALLSGALTAIACALYSLDKSQIERISSEFKYSPELFYTVVTFFIVICGFSLAVSIINIIKSASGIKSMKVLKECVNYGFCEVGSLRTYAITTFILMGVSVILSIMSTIAIAAFGTLIEAIGNYMINIRFSVATISITTTVTSIILQLANIFWGATMLRAAKLNDSFNWKTPV